MSGSERPRVIVFRKQLLPWSETFIASQGAALERYRAVFAGYTHGPAGWYLDGHDRVVLADFTRSPRIARALLKAFGRLPRRWLRELRARRPALVHAHFGTNALDAHRIARVLGVPLVVTFHGSDIAKPATKPAHQRKRQRVFDAASRVIAVSEFIAQQLRANGCPPAKIVLHHIGVDTQRFAPGDEAARNLRRILFVGRMVGKKGAIHLIRAMPAVQQAIPGAELVLAGDGPLRERLEHEAARLDVNARFPGVQSPEEVRALMQTSAVFCAPSIVTRTGDAEGLPMTVVEAQACGCPVVASPSGGTAEGIVDGESGFVVPSGDGSALAAALIRVLGDEDLRLRLSAGARRNVLTRFDLGVQCGRLEEIYDGVVDETAGNTGVTRSR